ncbi:MULTISPECIES: CGNR zinc finger domain-containing protein [unclassified Curtobacterium]|uniref:CGNR zinc finger domain-containing protein n=1 Tax=unclassified Curtobacterium TaxID=257496 RepID=UPI0009F3B9FE
MDEPGHFGGLVAAAIDLANAAGPESAWGRPHRAPTGKPAQKAVGNALALIPASQHALAPADVEQLLSTGQHLWRAMFIAAAGDLPAAAGLVNEMLSRVSTQPHLTQHGTQPWHLHFAPPGSGPGREWSAELVVAVASLFGTRMTDRLRSCAAHQCDRVLVDETRNHTQRYCSVSCQNRTKVAAFRARTGHAASNE